LTTAPWQIEGVTVSVGATASSQPGLVSTQTLRGLWFVQLGRL
jgi:hypothetical protein